MHMSLGAGTCRRVFIGCQVFQGNFFFVLGAFLEILSCLAFVSVCLDDGKETSN